jgi:hypothetical protein
VNKNIKEAMHRQSIRRMHRKVVKKILSEQEHTLYSTFVQPFTDVVDAVGLTGQDILNSLRLSFDLIFTLSPKKMKEAHAKFDERSAKIDAKWGPIMERTDEALANSDLNLFALVMAPEIFLASEALAAGYQAAESMNSYLSDSGWKIPFASAILGYTPESGGSGGSSGGDDGQSLLGKLTSLFGIESAWHDGPLILEQEKFQKPEKEPDFKKAMKKYLKDTGLSSQFEKDAKELLKIQEEFVQTILDNTLPNLTLINDLSQSTDVETFTKAITDAEQNGLELQSAGLDKVKSGVEDAAKKLAQSDEFKAQVAEESGKKISENSEKITDKEVEDAAMKVAFVNAKKDFDEQALKGKESLKAAALEELESNVPDEKNMTAMRSSTTGQSFIKLIEDAKQKIENA